MISFRSLFKTSACLAMLGVTMPLLLVDTNGASASISHAIPRLIEQDSSINCDVRIENGKLSVKIDGREVSDDRIDLTRNGIVILDGNGEPMQEVSLPADALETIKSSLAAGDEAPKQDTADKAMLGITIEQEETGILIAEVRHGTPAKRSGLQPGDVITKVMGKPATEDLLKQIISERGPGKTIMLTLTRDGNLMRKRVKLAAWDDSKMDTVDAEETFRQVEKVMRERSNSRNEEAREFEEEIMGAERMRTFIVNRMRDIGIDGDIDIDVEMIVNEMLEEIDEEDFARMMDDGERVVVETPDGMMIVDMNIEADGDQDLDLEEVMMILSEMAGEESRDDEGHGEWEHDREDGVMEEFHHEMTETMKEFHHEMAGAMEEMHRHFDHRIIEIEKESHNRFQETMGQMEEMMNHARKDIEHRLSDIHGHFETFGNQTRKGMEQMGQGVQEMVSKMRHGMEDMGHNFRRTLEEFSHNQQRQLAEMQRAIGKSQQRQQHLQQRVEQLEQQVRQLMKHMQSSRPGDDRGRRMERMNRGNRENLRGQRNSNDPRREVRNPEREQEFARERERMERERMGRERMERERMDRERMERERMERERMERERMERERMERARQESNQEQDRGQRNRGSRNRDQEDR